MNRAESPTMIGVMPAESIRRRELFARITREHGAALQRLCFGYEAIEARREELLQEILAAIWSGLPRYRGEASLRTWTYRVAHNVAASHVARAARRADRRASAAPEADARPAERERSVDSDLDALRALERLRTAIATLKPLDRQLVMLSLEELPHDEIAAIAGLTRDNVSTRLSRVRKQLAERLRSPT